MGCGLDLERLVEPEVHTAANTNEDSEDARLLVHSDRVVGGGGRKHHILAITRRVFQRPNGRFAPVSIGCSANLGCRASWENISRTS